MFSLSLLLLPLLLGSLAAQGDDDSCRCYQKLELGIILDSSSSIHPDDFELGKQFIQDYLDKFAIGPDNLRASLITYGQGLNEQDAFYLDSYTNKVDLLNAIRNTPHRHTRYTNTEQAIEFMRERQLASGLVRPDAKRVSVVITDGNSQNREITREEAAKARQRGITMFAVGVGPEVIKEELESIAGSPSRWDIVVSYDKLNTIIEWLKKETCLGGLGRTNG